MVLLGLLLVVLSVGSVALLAGFNRSGGPDHTVMLFGNEIVAVDGWQIFTAGAVLALVFCLGVWMMTAAARRRRALRKEVSEARHDARAAAAERDRLAEQLNEQQQHVPAQAEYTDADDTPRGGRRRFFNRHAERTPTTTGAPTPDNR